MMHRKRFSEVQMWTVVAWSLSVMGMYGMDRGAWRHVVMSVAAIVMIVALGRFAQGRMRGKCDECHSESLTR